MSKLKEKGKPADPSSNKEKTASPAFKAPKKKLKWLKRVILLAAVAAALFFALRACG